jgi:indole-3-glycerol phosphate synthase
MDDSMNFDTILQDVKSRYSGFHKEVKTKRKPKSLADAIRNAKGSAIISEIKPASPSGKIRTVEDPAIIAGEMIRGGACAISVLTEEKFFGGSLKNMQAVARVSTVPVLRKDFIFDVGQIEEAYYYGADSVLLISSFFDVDELARFIGKSRALGMEPLVEVHSTEDVKKAQSAGAIIFGINNRDKDTLEIDLERTKLLEGVDGIRVSASGVKNAADLKFVLKYTDAALIGTEIMNAKNIEEKVREFVRA